MRMFPAMVLLFIASTCVLASDPGDFTLWKGTVIQDAGKRLSPKIDDQKFAWESMGTYKNHLIGVSHREGDGSAELHETQVDIWIVESGEATVVQGGKIVGLSMFSGYSFNERTMLSLGVADPDIEIGHEVTLVWGESGGAVSVWAAGGSGWGSGSVSSSESRSEGTKNILATCSGFTPVAISF